MSRSDKKTLIIILLVLVILVGLVTAYNTLGGRIPSNEPGTIGNTAGNLNNQGLFCEDDGRVYFANAYDGYALYSMNPDETDMKKLANAQVEDINAGGDYLYYFQSNSADASNLSFISRFSGIYRSKKDGSKSKCLTRDTSALALLVGDYLYYEHFEKVQGLTLYKLKTDKSEEFQLVDYDINPAGIAGGLIYFAGTQEDHALYMLNTADDSIRRVWNGRIWNAVPYGDYIYYMDLDTNYGLSRYSISGGYTEILTRDRVDTFNIVGNYIYYQKNDKEHPALKRIMLDGQYEEVIREGNYEKINATSRYIYFSEFGEPTPVYRVPADGYSTTVTTFDAAQYAAPAAAE